MSTLGLNPNPPQRRPRRGASTPPPASGGGIVLPRDEDGNVIDEPITPVTPAIPDLTGRAINEEQRRLTAAVQRAREEQRRRSEGWKNLKRDYEERARFGESHVPINVNDPRYGGVKVRASQVLPVMDPTGGEDRTPADGASMPHGFGARGVAGMGSRQARGREAAEAAVAAERAQYLQRNRDLYERDDAQRQFEAEKVEYQEAERAKRAEAAQRAADERARKAQAAADKRAAATAAGKAKTPEQIAADEAEKARVRTLQEERARLAREEAARAAERHAERNDPRRGAAPAKDPAAEAREKDVAAARKAWADIYRDLYADADRATTDKFDARYGKPIDEAAIQKRAEHLFRQAHPGLPLPAEWGAAPAAPAAATIPGRPGEAPAAPGAPAGGMGGPGGAAVPDVVSNPGPTPPRAPIADPIKRATRNQLALREYGKLTDDKAIRKEMIAISRAHTAGEISNEEFDAFHKTLTLQMERAQAGAPRDSIEAAERDYIDLRTQHARAGGRPLTPEERQMRSRHAAREIGGMDRAQIKKVYEILQKNPKSLVLDDADAQELYRLVRERAQVLTEGQVRRLGSVDIVDSSTPGPRPTQISGQYQVAPPANGAPAPAPARAPVPVIDPMRDLAEAGRQPAISIPGRSAEAPLEGEIEDAEFAAAGERGLKRLLDGPIAPPAPTPEQRGAMKYDQAAAEIAARERPQYIDPRTGLPMGQAGKFSGVSQPIPEPPPPAPPPPYVPVPDYYGKAREKRRAMEDSFRAVDNAQDANRPAHVDPRTGEIYYPRGNPNKPDAYDRVRQKDRAQEDLFRAVDDAQDARDKNKREIVDPRTGKISEVRGLPDRLYSIATGSGKGAVKLEPPLPKFTEKGNPSFKEGPGTKGPKERRKDAADRAQRIGDRDRLAPAPLQKWVDQEAQATRIARAQAELNHIRKRPSKGSDEARRVSTPVSKARRDPDDLEAFMEDSETGRRVTASDLRHKRLART